MNLTQINRKQGDEIILREQIEDDLGDVFDLTDAQTVDVVVYHPGREEIVANDSATITTAAEGKVEYTLDGTQTTREGTHQVVWRVQLADGAYFSYPGGDKFFTFSIGEQLDFTANPVEFDEEYTFTRVITDYLRPNTESFVSVEGDLQLNGNDVLNPGAIEGHAEDPHGNASHTDTFAVDGDTQPPEDHGNASHTSAYYSAGDDASFGAVDTDQATFDDDRTDHITIDHPDHSVGTTINDRRFKWRDSGWSQDNEIRPHVSGYGFTARFGDNEYLITGYRKISSPDGTAKALASFRGEGPNTNDNGLSYARIQFTSRDQNAGSETGSARMLAYQSGSEITWIDFRPDGPYTKFESHDIRVDTDRGLQDDDGSNLVINGSDYVELPKQIQAKQGVLVGDSSDSDHNGGESITFPDLSSDPGVGNISQGGRLYAKGGELYWIDSGGTTHQITS